MEILKVSSHSSPNSVAGAIIVEDTYLVCGDITGGNMLTVASPREDNIVYINEEQFENYLSLIKVTFNANGGSVADGSKDVFYGQPYGSLPTPTRDYHTFLGWYTAANGGEKVTSDTVVETLAPQTLYAHWEINTFTLNFNANGGSVSEASRTVTCGAAVGTLPTPTRTGFTFSGWFNSAGEKITAYSKLVSSAPVTLTAKWNAIAYTASWNTGNGYSITVNRTSSPNANAATGTLASGATVYYGDVLSVTYTRADYYTITSNGVTSITVNGNITASDIYASATLKDIKGWTVASKVPSDAQITDTKWTYTLKEETSTTNPDSINENDGWRWKSSARTGWGPTQGPVYTKPTSGSQNIVKEESYVSGYEKMTQYQYSRYLNYEGSKGYSYSNGARCYPISSGYCTYGPYYTGWVNTPFLIRENSSLSSCGHMHGGSATANYDSLGLTWYNEETRTVDNPDKPIYGTRWYYQDAVYTHYYYRYVEKETAYDPTGWENVSNIVKYYRYREK